jgi:rubrerythrin
MSEDMLKWIQFAIDTEEKGLEFYRECLEKVKHPRGMELFEFLIKAEKGHKKTLKDLLDAVSRGDSETIKKSVDAFMEMDIHNPLFDRDSLKRLTGTDSQIFDMFNTAIEFEEKGIEMYSELEKKEQDPDIKRLLKRLADDEVMHRRELIDLGHFVFGMPAPSDHVEEGEGY